MLIKNEPTANHNRKGDERENITKTQRWQIDNSAKLPQHTLRKQNQRKQKEVANEQLKEWSQDATKHNPKGVRENSIAVW
jgi:hypothetical protein